MGFSSPNSWRRTSPEKHHSAIVSMTYLNPRSARLKGDITALPRLGLIQASAIIVYPNLVRTQNTFSDILIEA